MRKVLLFVFVFVGVAFACAKPKVVFSEVEYVFTDNVLGETSEHVFVFKNEPLRGKGSGRQCSKIAIFSGHLFSGLVIYIYICTEFSRGMSRQQSKGRQYELERNVHCRRTPL